jgi:hypothetical protein
LSIKLRIYHDACRITSNYHAIERIILMNFKITNFAFALFFCKSIYTLTRIIFTFRIERGTWFRFLRTRYSTCFSQTLKTNINIYVTIYIVTESRVFQGHYGKMWVIMPIRPPCYLALFLILTSAHAKWRYQLLVTFKMASDDEWTEVTWTQNF